MSFEIPARPGIKIYLNEGRTITIQQTGSGLPTDPFVDLHPGDAQDFINGIKQLLKEHAKTQSNVTKPVSVTAPPS